MKQLLAKKDEIFSIYLFALLIPLNPKCYGMGLALIAIESLIKRKHIHLKSWRTVFQTNNPNLWLILFYLLHIFGLLYSENMSFAWMDIGMKLPLLLLPIFFLLFKFKLNQSQVWIFFIYGCLLSLILYGSMSIIQFIKTRELNIGVAFSFWMHRGYYATYLVIAFTFISIKMLYNKKVTFAQTLVLLALVVGVYFTEAKLGVITLVMIAISLGLYALKQKLGWLKFSFSLVLFVLLSTLTVSLVLKGNNRFSGAVYHLQNQEKRDNTSIESTTARILLWETSIELIKEKPIFGFGTGDIKDVLRARNYEKGYTGVADANYNAHNQFLNSWIALGVLGTLCLLLVFLTLFNQPNSAPLLFTRYTTIIFFLMFLTESFLEVQSGIIPFAFLVSILSTIKKPHYPSF